MKKKVARSSLQSTKGSSQQNNFANAKQLFFISVLSMSWQLAITVVVPVVAGVKLDQKFSTAPSLTLTGFILATGAACMIVWNTVKSVNNVQSQQDKK